MSHAGVAAPHRDLPTRGLIVGKFAPLHAGHQLLIETAHRECTLLTILVYSNHDFPDMPQSVRAGWVRELYPHADVRTPTAPPVDSAPDDVHRRFVRDYLLAEAITIDVVYTSETYGEGFAAMLGVPYRLLDLDRRAVPVSGTAVRADPGENAGFLPALVRRHFGL